MIRPLIFNLHENTQGAPEFPALGSSHNHPCTSCNNFDSFWGNKGINFIHNNNDDPIYLLTSDSTQYHI